ncbi:hypothetical protein [Archangium sp.]|uniref:hypothetical protein n=1 Tax=Archangium sp. TaxID=1872627 RepID=UPI00286B1E87|nr:hypothetical protein [Archangium sp.]
MKSRVMLLAALASTVVGCKKEQPPTPAAAAPKAPTAAAPPSAAPAPVRKDPLVEVPSTDSTLSVLEPKDGRCQWLRMDPVASKRAVVASLEGDCKGARVSWSPDLGKALVWFDPANVRSAGYFSSEASPAAWPDETPTKGAQHRLYEVTLASGEVRPVPFPPEDGEVRDIGYDAKGLLARALQPLTDEQQLQGSVIVDGQELSFDSEAEGLPALAFGYRLDAQGKWKRVEAKATSDGADLAPGLGALELQAQGPDSIVLLSSNPTTAYEEPTPEQVTRLLPFVPPLLLEKVKAEGMPEDSVGWLRATTSAGAFYIWQVTGDTPHTTGHLVLEAGEQRSPAKELGFTDGDVVSVDIRGPFLLVASQRAGTHPRLYDLRTRALAFRSDTPRAVTFWPPAPRKDAQSTAGTP